MNQEPITAYPLAWPMAWKRTPREKIRRSRFGTYSNAGHSHNPPSTHRGTQALLNELRLLGARDVVISTNLQLRNDGLPYSNQREPSDAGAAVYFVLNKKPRVLACDAWRTVGENLYAIAKHVEALRGQERWGVGTLDQAFTGYAALPAETGQHWTSVLGLGLNATRDDINAKAREIIAREKLHPDVGGDSAAFQRIVNAREQALADIAPP